MTILAEITLQMRTRTLNLTQWEHWSGGLWALLTLFLQLKGIAGGDSGFFSMDSRTSCNVKGGEVIICPGLGPLHGFGK